METKKGKAIVIINEQHTLLKGQKAILEEQFDELEYLKVPANGWTLQEQKEKVSELLGNTIVFVSPIPYMVKALAYVAGYASEENCMAHNGPLQGRHTRVFVFHNDRRDKKELPNGKIISVMSEEGWQLI